MRTTIIVAAVAMLAGTVAGYLLCGAAYRKLRKRYRALSKGLKKKMGVMDRILVLEGVFLLLYTVADLIVFWHTGAEPTTLTACVFSLCGLENGVMGWIKTNKDQINGKTEHPEGEDPPPVG